MRKFIATVMAVLAIALISNSPAQAGKGLKLKFGFPLGTFIAKPGKAKSHQARKRQAAKRRAAQRRATQKRAAQKRAAQKRAAQKRAAQKRAAAAKRKKQLAANKAAAERRRKAAIARKVAKQRAQSKAALRKAADKLADVPVPAAAPWRKPLTTKAEAKDGKTAPREAGQKLAEPNAGKQAPVTTATVRANSETPSPAASLAPSPARSGVVSATQTVELCKRFVPSAGLTITVPCTR